jgi:hypothetical protein
VQVAVAVVEELAVEQGKQVVATEESTLQTMQPQHPPIAEAEEVAAEVGTLVNLAKQAAQASSSLPTHNSSHL